MFCSDFKDWAALTGITSLVTSVLSIVIMVVIWVWPKPDKVPRILKWGALFTLTASLFFLLGVLVGNCSCKTPCPDPVVAFQQGVSNVEKKDYDQAIHWYGEALRCGYQPKSEIHYRLGNLHYYEKRQLELAIDEYSKAIVSGYRNLDAAYLQRGRAYSDRWVLYGQNPADYDHAISDFEEAIKQGGNLGEIYLSKGSLQVNAHKYQEAIAGSLAQVIGQGYELTQSYLWQGRAYARLGKTTEAIEAYVKAIQQATIDVPNCQDSFLNEAYLELSELDAKAGGTTPLRATLEKSLQGQNTGCRAWAEQKLKELSKVTPRP
jgi:tetratricopeptide (TPR) repeat protein